MNGVQALPEKTKCGLEQLRETGRAVLVEAVLRNELEKLCVCLDTKPPLYKS